MMKKGIHQHNDDKLSDLPDCLLLHILSFLNINEAVRTGSLSTRWKHLWKRLQTLSFDHRPFRTYKHFTEFVIRVLSLRDASTALIALDFQTSFTLEHRLLETIETVAASQNQNLKRLTLYCHIERIPNFLFSCHSLESLTLMFAVLNAVVFPNSLNLPALTYLKLRGLVFRGGDDGRAKPFSCFNKLNSLIIEWCNPEEHGQTLCISNVMLVDLVIDAIDPFWNIELFASNLCTLTFNGNPYQKLSGSSLSSVKHVNIDGYRVGVIPGWLIELVNLESLTISAITLQALSEFPDSSSLLKHNSWSNLKSLQVILERHKEQILTMMRQRDVNHEVAGGKPWKGNVKLREAIKALEPYAYISNGAIEFFIQNSPSATVDILIPKQPEGYYFL